MTVLKPTIKGQNVSCSPIPGNSHPFHKIVGIILPPVSLWNYPAYKKLTRGRTYLLRQSAFFFFFFWPQPWAIVSDVFQRVKIKILGSRKWFLQFTHACVTYRKLSCPPGVQCHSQRQWFFTCREHQSLQRACLNAVARATSGIQTLWFSAPVPGMCILISLRGLWHSRRLSFSETLFQAD